MDERKTGTVTTESDSLNSPSSFEQLTKFYTQLPKPDKGPERVERKIIYPQQAIAAAGSTDESAVFRYQYEVGNSGVMDIAKTYMNIRLGLQRRNAGDDAWQDIENSDEINLASHFNLFKRCKLYLNDYEVQTTVKPGLINWLNTALSSSAENIASKHSFHKSWNDPLANGNCYDNLGYTDAYGGLDSVLVATDANQLDDNKEFKVSYAADTGVPTVNTMADADHIGKVMSFAPKMLKFLAPARVAGYYGDDKYSIARKKYMIDAGRSNNGGDGEYNFATFMIPIKYFFSFFDVDTNTYLLPIKKIEMVFERDVSSAYLISDPAKAVRITVFSANIETRLYYFDSVTAQRYNEALGAFGKTGIPYMIYKIDDSLAIPYPAGPFQVNYPAETGVCHVFNMFHGTNQPDPFAFRLPSLVQAANGQMKKDVMYGEAFYPYGLQSDTYSDFGAFDWVKPFRELQDASSDDADQQHGTLLSYQTFPNCPIWSTKIGHVWPGNWSDSEDTRPLVIKFTYGAAVADTRMVTVICKQSVLIWDHVSGTMAHKMNATL